jgi:hypothetical protein
MPVDTTGTVVGSSVGVTVSVAGAGLVAVWVKGAGFSVGVEAGTSAGWLPHADKNPIVRIDSPIFIFSEFIFIVLLESI